MRMWMMFSFSLIVACQQKKVETPVQAEEKAPVLDTHLRPGLLFTYLDAQGEQRSTERIEDIPDDHRQGVRVIDLNVAPEARGAGKWVYIVDLRAPLSDGSYPYQALSHVAFDRNVASAPLRQKVGDALEKSTSQVTVYSTAWCGVCAQAKGYLKAKNVAFVERDVEKDETAAVELSVKAKRAGVSPQGVPVIDVYGELMMGFDKNRLDALLARKSTQTL
jgi:glutaredoxin